MEKRGRGGVVPLKQLVIIRPAILPALHEPLRMGVADGGALAAEIVQSRAPVVHFAEAISEHGIDKSRLRAEVVPAGEVYRFVHGGVAGDAVEPENLV